MNRRVLTSKSDPANGQSSRVSLDASDMRLAGQEFRTALLASGFVTHAARIAYARSRLVGVALWNGLRRMRGRTERGRRGHRANVVPTLPSRWVPASYVEFLGHCADPASCSSPSCLTRARLICRRAAHPLRGAVVAWASAVTRETRTSVRNGSRRYVATATRREHRRLGWRAPGAGARGGSAWPL